VLLEVLDHVLDALAAKRQHVDRGQLEVRRHPHLRHRERIAVEHLIDDLAAGKDLGERVPDQLAHLQLALARRSSLVAIGHRQSRMIIMPGLDPGIHAVIGSELQWIGLPGEARQ
jgi:hypothetical protein